MPRLAWFSPLSHSAVLRSSALTEAFLRHRPKKWEVELFVDDRELSFRGAADFFGCPVHHHLTAALRDAENPFDYFIFQIEDHPAAEYCRTSLALWPGVAFFHDLHFTESAAEVRNRAARSRKEQVPETDQSHDSAYDTSLLYRTAGLAIGFDVRGFHALQPHTGPTAPAVLPFLLEPAEPDRRAARTALAIAEGELVLSYAGKYSVEDRMHLVLRLFNELCSERAEQPVKLLWIIADDFAEAQANSALAGFSSDRAREQILFRRPDTRDELRRCLCATDLFIGLKFDALRALPLALLTALECGVPALVSNFGASAELAPGCALSIEVGNLESKLLGESVRRVLADEALRADLGTAARAFSEITGDAALWIGDFALLLGSHEERLRKALEARRELYAEQEALLASKVIKSEREALAGLGMRIGDDAEGRCG